ncbi:hypothetical protein M9Y10_020606 [Tritrichomonas musculus]|uniref:DUF3447 domain-containing protein n=1 Tax=Tritrichomonas musculus TaxID=1915356 RepID=A0ABR2HF27_9EUKA
MQNIFGNEDKIEVFSKLQQKLRLLEPHSSDEKLNELLNSIPPDYLTQKDDLKVICELFALYSRSTIISTKSNFIKLFEKIMQPIKTYLQNESYFFWNIFGGIYYFKLWMYREGLITIDQIIQFCQKTTMKHMIEYFTPEIIEKVPEIYDKEIKYLIDKPLSKEYIEDLKEVRKKHFNWLRNSSDFNDQIYEEIEKESIRLAIKRDDIDSFQKIISNTNLPINSRIRESMIENFLRFDEETTLIEYAIQFNSIKIFQFLVMNDVTLDDSMIWSSVFSNNYEIVHFLENRFNALFPSICFCNSISCWNDEINEYILNNYSEFDFFQQSEVELKDNDILLDIVRETIYYLNFSFFEKILIPFFKQNQKIVDDNINIFLLFSTSENSCFFLPNLLKHPKCDVNYFYQKVQYSIVGGSMIEGNLKAFEMIVNNPEFDVNGPCNRAFSPLIFACGCHCDMKIVEMIFNHPKLKENIKNSFRMAAMKGNFYALQYLVDNSDNAYTDNFFLILFFTCLCDHHLLILKIILKLYLKLNKQTNCDDLIEEIDSNFSNNPNYRNDFNEDFKKIYEELTNM